jgi:plasmid stabilization system protein ParE
MIVEYHPAVLSELEEIRDFYEERVPGLGREFLDEFERQAQRIAATPRRWMVISGDIRRAMMPRFPHLIYFRQTQSGRIRVTIVKHQRRHPAYGLDRT